MNKRKKDESREEESAREKKRPKLEQKDDDGDSSETSVYLPEELYNETIHNPRIVEKLKKRVTFESSVPTYSLSDDILNGSKHNGSTKKEKKKSKLSNEMNGFGEVEEEPSSGYDFYLIRKPTDISIEELKSMDLSKASSSDKKVKLKIDKGTYILKPEVTPKPLVYFPSTEIMTAKDAQKIKSNGFITSQAVLTPLIKDVPGGPIYHEEEIPDNLEMMYPISSIRKNPDVNWETKKERLKAFGIKGEKRHKSKKSIKSEPI